MTTSYPGSPTRSDGPFEALNHSELYQMCRDAQINAHPATPRETLIQLLLGELEPPPNAPHPIDGWRHGIMGFLLEHWRAIESQLTCPAKSKDPRACFGCVDTQVISCLVTNEADLYRIRLHRK